MNVLASEPTLPPRVQASRRYAWFWRWHFLTGFFAVPILAIVALTGAALVFQDELHPLIYSQFDLATVSERTASLDAQLTAVEQAFPHDQVSSLTIYPTGSGRNTVAMLHLHDTGGDWLNPWNMGWAYVDPGTGEVVGMLTASQDVFELITVLHKSFFALLPGELLVDLATSWGVVSLLAGLYLWWPRRSEKIWGVWLPRLRGGLRLVLRDLHTVPSLYIAPVALVVCVSGVLLGLSAGPELLTVIVTGQVPQALLFPAKPDASAAATVLSLDDVMRTVGPHTGAEPYTVAIPHNSNYMIWYAMHGEPSRFRQTVVDPYIGDVKIDVRPDDLPAIGRLYYVLIFNEVLHRGTYWGWVGKTLTFIACLLVATMAITSWWMWWLRKPRQGLGIPPAAIGVKAPRWAMTGFIVTAVFLPLVGLSILTGRGLASIARLVRRKRT